jgi:hypothetical protein
MMRVGLLLVAAAVPLLGAGTACEKLVEMTIPLVRIESAAVVDGHCEVKAVARVDAGGGGLEREVSGSGEWRVFGGDFGCGDAEGAGGGVCDGES